MIVFRLRISAQNGIWNTPATTKTQDHGHSTWTPSKRPFTRSRAGSRPGFVRLTQPTTHQMPCPGHLQTPQTQSAASSQSTLRINKHLMILRPKSWPPLPPAEYSSLRGRLSRKQLSRTQIMPPFSTQCSRTKRPSTQHPGVQEVQARVVLC